MLKAALTGGIACGKSTVLKLFRELDPAHIFVQSADDIVHQLYQPGSPVVAEIVQNFGASVVDADGTIDRKQLANIAFADENKRKRLEAIVHPAVIGWQTDWLRQIAQQHPEATLALIEVPLLFEANSEKRFDKTIAVTCSAEQKIARFRARHPEMNEEQAAHEVARRSAAQLSDAEKSRRADWIIDNSGTYDQLRHNVAKAYVAFTVNAPA